MPAEADPPGWILKSWNCSFELSNVTTTFGKEDSDCLIPFRSVSKHHAVIAWDPKKQQYKIKEAPFSLGTFVNDSRIGVRSIIITLGDTIRFGADSPTFRVEVKEKEKEVISPRKTLSTVHDIEKEDPEDWPERTQNQTVVSNNKPFVITPLVSSPQPKSAPRTPAAKITSYEPPDLRDESPLLRASRDLSLSRTSIDDFRGRASTPSSASRSDNKRPIRNKGPKGSALYGQPAWWGEDEVENNQSPSTPDNYRRTPKHSHSTEFDPFDGYSASDRHDYADYPTPRSDNGYRDNGYRGDRDNGYRGGFGRERSYNGNGNHGNNDSHGRPTSGYYDEDRYSERSFDRHTDRSYPGTEDRRNYRPPPTSRYEERVYTPPPAKPGMAFQITFDEPKSSPPRHPGKKKRGTPPKPDNNEDKKSNVSETSRKSLDSNRSSDHGSDLDKQSNKQSDKGSDKGSDMKIDDIELSLPDEPSNECKSEECRTEEDTRQSDEEESLGSQSDVNVEDPAVKKELTKWANSLLKKKDYVPVFSIHDSVKDGRTLAQLLHSITDEKVSDLTKDPKLRVEILPNIDKCLAFSKEKNLTVGDIASRDIVKGNELQVTILLEQLRAAHKRKLARPAVPKDESKDSRQNTASIHTSHSTHSTHSTHNHAYNHALQDFSQCNLDWNISQTWLKKLVSEAELTDDEGVLPFRRNKTMAAPPRAKRAHQPISSEDKPTAQLERMLLHTLNDLTQQLKTKIDKSAVYSLHIKEELDSIAGNNAPEDFVVNSISVPPPPGSENNAIPDSEITEALKNLRFLERKLAEIEENLVYVRNETIPSLAKKGHEKPKKKKKGLSGIFKKDKDLKGSSSVASINSLSDSGLASAGGGGVTSAGGGGVTSAGDCRAMKGDLVP